MNLKPHWLKHIILELTISLGKGCTFLRVNQVFIKMASKLDKLDPKTISFLLRSGVTRFEKVDRR